jgi:Cof subfamily protein (haloacid dehalogenase superfamily)
LKGTLALDIDGTVTASHLYVPTAVVDCLARLSKKGWDIAFITGRPFSHCMKIFPKFNFPYYIAPQNGAALVEMPSKRIIKKRYLSRELLPEMDEICGAEGTDYVIYSGLETFDRVLFRRGLFSKEIMEFLADRTKQFGEEWNELSSFSDLGISSFASVKCFAQADQAERIARKMVERLSLHAPVITDPFDVNYRVVQGTHPDVTKGRALRDLLKERGSQKLPVIAAGDDSNDIPLLQAATIKIVMGSASPEIQKMADIVAAPASQLGLIDALNTATARF